LGVILMIPIEQHAFFSARINLLIVHTETKTIFLD
jgi:hypothetical protein